MAASEPIDWVPALSNAATREQAVESLRAVLLRGLKGAFLRRGVDDAFCEDMSQVATMRVLDNVESFEGRSKFTTWATSIAIRAAISELRRRHHKDVSLEAIAGDESLRIDIPEDDDGGPAAAMEQREILKTLKNLIEEDLTKKQRVVVQALLNGMPVEEIASRTDSNRNAIYKLYHDARVRLKSGLEREDVTAADLNRAFS